MEEENGLSRDQRNRSMKYSTADGMAYTLMTGVGDAYVPAAAIALGASDFYIGLLAALPQFVGAMLQFASLRALRLARSRKTLVVAGSLLQALCWLPTIAMLLWPGTLSVPIITIFFSLGSGLTLMVNPAWSSWVSDIVPENERASFFAGRNRLMQFVLFLSTFIAGFLLQQLGLGLPASAAFGLVFIIPFLSRLASTFFNTQVSDVGYNLQLVKEIELKHLFLLPSYRNELWFLVFMALVNLSTQVASPFFTPYMLSNLGFDMGMFGLMTAASVLTKFAAYPYWGKAIDRFGNRAVLVAASFGMSLVPLMWLFSISPPWLLVFQAFSGFVWAGMDLASFNFALSMVGRELRPSFISKYNAFNGVFYAAGSVAGGLYLQYWGGASLLGFSGILAVFLISGVLRLVVTVLFTPKLSTSREVENTTGQRGMVFRLVAVYPTQGAVHQVMDGWNFTRKIVADGTAKSERALAFGLGATGEVLKEGGRKLASRISRKKSL